MRRSECAGCSPTRCPFPSIGRISQLQQASRSDVRIRFATLNVGIPQESVRSTKVLGLAPFRGFRTRTSVPNPGVAESADDRESAYRLVLGPTRSSRGHVVGLSKSAWYGLNPIKAPGGLAWDPGGLPQGQVSVFRYVRVWYGG